MDRGPNLFVKHPTRPQTRTLGPSRPLVRGKQIAKAKLVPAFFSFGDPQSRGLNWHGLRHFAVSCWIEAGLAPKTVQTFAGHATLQVTMDRYGHLFPSEDHKKAMDQIAKGLFV